METENKAPKLKNLFVVTLEEKTQGFWNTTSRVILYFIYITYLLVDTTLTILWILPLTFFYYPTRGLEWLLMRIPNKKGYGAIVFIIWLLYRILALVGCILLVIKACTTRTQAEHKEITTFVGKTVKSLKPEK